MKRFPKLLRNASSGLARQRSTTPESSTAQWQLKVQPVQRGPEIHRIEEGDDPSMFIEGSLEVKLPNFQQYGQMKSRDGKSQRREEKKTEDPGARKGRKVGSHSVFPMSCGSRGWKSRLAKAAGAEPCGQMRDDKLHAVVARSTCPSQKRQKLTVSDQCWTFRCRFAWQAQGIVHIVKSEENVRVL